MSATWREPGRDITVAGRPDVVVVGAGSAGVAAAIAAARRGADTWLIEASGTVGGLATVGLINLLLTLDDGAGTQVVAGICQEVVDRLSACGEARFPGATEWGSSDAATVARWRRWGLIWGAPETVRYSVAFDPDAFVDVCLEMLAEASVRLRLATWFAAAPVANGRVEALLVESKRGREAILPQVVIDATGDGDVLAAAGAPWEQVPIPPHLWYRVGGVDLARAADGPWFETTAPGRVLVPWGPHADRVDPCDPDDLTRAMIDCRRSAVEHFHELRRIPGFESAWFDGAAQMLGITESRRLVGDYVLSREDAGAVFDDSVACTGHWTKHGAVFGIPMRALTASGLANLIACGRCISTTRYVHQATKEIPAAMATGEAAGAAASQLVGPATTTPGDVHELATDVLRADLVAGGAIVDLPVSRS